MSVCQVSEISINNFSFVAFFGPFLSLVRLLIVAIIQLGQQRPLFLWMVKGMQLSHMENLRVVMIARKGTIYENDGINRKHKSNQVLPLSFGYYEMEENRGSCNPLCL